MIPLVRFETRPEDGRLARLLARVVTALVDLAALAAVTAPLTFAREAEAQSVRQVRGTVRYEDYTKDGALFAVYPVRYVEVEISVGSTVLGRATTDGAGYFSRFVDGSKATAGARLAVRLESVNHAADVRYAATGQRAAWIVRKPIPPAPAPIDMSTTIRFADNAVAFEIVDALTTGHQYVEARRGDTDDLVQADVRYGVTDGNHFEPSSGEIHLTRNGGFEDEVSIHEYAHHLEWAISDVDASGGHDAGCAGRSYEHAWTEGFAFYLEAAVPAFHADRLDYTKDPEPLPRCMPIDPRHEETTEKVLWDIHDGAGGTVEPFDRLNGPAWRFDRLILQIFDRELDNGSAPSQLVAFHDAFVARNPHTGSHADLDRLLARYNVLPHALANYRVESVAVSAPTVVAGGSLTVTTRVSRTGIAYGDRALGVRLYLFSFAGVVELARYTVSSTFSGTLATGRTVVVPSTLPAGSYALLAEVDPDDVFPESVETDNTGSVFVEVRR